MKNLARWGEGIVGDAKPDTVIALSLDGNVISRAELFARQLNIGGRRLKFVGIGGVWTQVESRRLGLASSLVASANVLAHKWGRDGTILFSLEELVPLYTGLGFRRCLGSISMLQPDARVVPVPDHVVTMLLPFGDIDFDIDFVNEGIDIVGLPW
jgi:hypothetical protein